MRTHSAALLVLLTLAAQTAFGPAPNAAAAEGFGGPCGSTAPGAILPLPAHFNATTGSPYTPSTAEFTDSEPLPLSNFTATANWGDGTTTPASITSARCHVVSAPSHVYSHSGAYEFSYTIHDAHTGLDHVIGADTAYIWGTPERVDAPSSRTINATVGVPWSGVLGEFTEESLPFTGAGYYANIEWETGNRDWMPGTITAQANGTLVVSATHVFTAEYSGTATVIVGITEATSSWPVSVSVQTQAASDMGKPTAHFAFRGQPILAAIPSAKGSSAYEVIFRLDRPLPRAKSGRIQASLDAEEVGWSLAGFGPHKHHDCYAAGVGTPTKSALSAPGHYPFTLNVERPTGVKSGRATLHRYFNFVSMLSGASKRLGC